jgi:acetylornithine/N-succinyldiaminopimelate aminotransferase
LACAVAKVVIDELVDGGVLDHAKSMGERLGEGLEAIAAEIGTDRIRGVRGRGLLRGLALNEAPAKVIERCRERGLLVISAGDNVLRLAPPLVISADEIDRGLADLREALLEDD